MCYSETNVLFSPLMVLVSGAENPIWDMRWGSEVKTPVMFSLELIYCRATVTTKSFIVFGKVLWQWFVTNFKIDFLASFCFVNLTRI